ncbi:MAG: hypothetical protein ACK4MV_16490 [Beijerinckiaceae bacterium]
MKNRSFGYAAMLFAVAAVAMFTLVSDAFAASLPVIGGDIPHPTSLGQFAAEVGLALRLLGEKRTDLVGRAAAKQGEIKDGMTPEQVRAIEDDHADLMRQIAEIDKETETLTRAASSTPPSPPTPPVDVQGAIAAERSRSSEIRSIGAAHEMDLSDVARFIDEGRSVQEFRNFVLDKLAERSRDGAGRGLRQTSIEVVRDEGDTRRENMALAIEARLARAGGDRQFQIADRAREYGERALVELAADVIGYRGLIRTPQQVHQVFERAFHTTSDFPAIMLDAMNRRLMARYQAAQPTYRRFCARYTVADFRPMNVIRAGDFPALQPVNESGEIKSGTFSESKEQIVVSPYGVKLSFTRQMIVNDQLGAIDQVLASSGVRVADWENVKAFEVLTAGSGVGPVLLTDSKRLFHADHNNYTSSGTIIDVANVGIGRALMMKQTTLDGIKANFVPVTLLTGPDKLTQAEQLLTTITPATTGNAVPESMRRLTPVGDANISGNAWYLFADPAVAPAFVYAYLEGFEGPRMTAENVFDVQGMKVKLEHDFGVAGIDFRGAYKNNGA